MKYFAIDTDTKTLISQAETQEQLDLSSKKPYQNIQIYESELTFEKQDITFEQVEQTEEGETYYTQNIVISLKLLSEAEMKEAYNNRAAIGEQIIEQMKLKRLQQVEKGEISIVDATTVSVDTREAQSSLRSGDWLDAYLILKNLPQSTLIDEYLLEVKTQIQSEQSGYSSDVYTSFFNSVDV